MDKINACSFPTLHGFDGTPGFCFSWGTDVDVEIVLGWWGVSRVIWFWAVKYFTKVLYPSRCLFALCYEVVAVLGADWLVFLPQSCFVIL